MSGTVETIISGDSENAVIRAEFPVNYAQFYLFDGNTYRTVHPEPGAPGESNAGILRTVRGGAHLVTGLYSGNIDLTVSLHHHAPEPLLEEYEDVVEASLQVDIDPITVIAWYSDKYIDLPQLPSGAGWYRLRYHARNMDQAFDLRSTVIIDSFHLQIWPAPQNDAKVLQVVSDRARRKLSH
ncbi:hypothetical protein [Streptosporangium subroseum]|uniref:hypothetical protein n=1 Tax=Streptosporangium subroseum TaxID=106412 RepID=UPI00308B7CD3|nr:hypothetical protein OHB15_18840 [Streptosporangium subroseum]